MRKLAGIMLCLTLLVGMCAAERGPTTPAEKKRAMDVIQKLELDPLDPALAKDREWVHQWVMEAPDVHVLLCTAILKPLLDEKNTDPRKALVLQDMLSMAAFELQNPEKAKNSTDMQLAGTEGMLRAYDAITKRTPTYKSDFMESLKEKKRSGTLESYVRQGEAECRARNSGTKLMP